MDNGESPEADDEDGEESLTEEEIKALRKELAAARKDLKGLKQELVKRIEKARADLSREDCWRLVLGVARADLAAQLDLYVTAHRHRLTTALEQLWDRYRATLREIEVQREHVMGQLAELVRTLGYAT